MATISQARRTASSHMWKLFVYSGIGAFMFFVPVTIAGRDTIMLDHIVTFLQSSIGPVLPFYALAVIVAGAVYPFVTGTWKKTVVDMVFSLLKVVGMVVGFMMVFRVGPAWLFEPGMGPFLFEKLVIPVGLLVPIGAVFLALLVSYGLLEFIGVMVQRVMRPIWRTPGRSAIDAVASFVGSYSLGLLITNRVYKEGKYTARESAIIATGFSTVSATFMVIVAKTLDLMGQWTAYFWVTFLVTFAVTAITVRIWPLNSIPDEYHPDATPQPEEDVRGSRLSVAWREAKETVATAPSLAVNVWVNVRDGVLMAMAILPSILSIGLLGLVLATYTPVFDWLGYVFYPFTWALQLPEPMLVAKASAVGVAEMFLPALLAAEAVPLVKFVVAVVSVSGIIFFSALVPCIMATDIPLPVWKMVVIWFQRVVLTLILVTPIAFLLFPA
ncbi:YjiH family protein [Pseudarthrobacter sp. J75]|uniref:YjiH family protein n=1 Tax=unclassified Pseudarthrobacter TaxID=2647000 RepID=UPI002E8148D6|nr:MULTISPECIES: YjiH family protein [unclassified Pseudarthrobacter]MEE2521092.1 YjiH family protein [Pseudarthrobacter sp. J47]MEE2528322.1 YjiH family protein [Pseudarthrobacter sp. J75]MEE2568017.1 YjiH family protein [Pseudarthrobacter sp. J64]